MTMWINTPFSHLTPWRMTRESVHYLTQALIDKQCKIQRMTVDMGTPSQRDGFQFVFDFDTYTGGFNDLCFALESNSSLKSIQIGKTWEISSLNLLFQSIKKREEFLNEIYEIKNKEKKRSRDLNMLKLLMQMNEEDKSLDLFFSLFLIS